MKDTQDIVSEGKRGLSPASFDSIVTDKAIEFPQFNLLLIRLLLHFDLGKASGSIC
jgi:hypothetical protein